MSCAPGNWSRSARTGSKAAPRSMPWPHPMAAKRSCPINASRPSRASPDRPRSPSRRRPTADRATCELGTRALMAVIDLRPGTENACFNDLPHHRICASHSKSTCNNRPNVFNANVIAYKAGEICFTAMKDSVANSAVGKPMTRPNDISPRCGPQRAAASSPIALPFSHRPNHRPKYGAA